MAGNGIAAQAPLELRVGGYLLSIGGDGALGAVEKGRPSITFNRDRVDAKGRKLPDGIEVRFGNARPTAELRELMKAHGFKFSEKQVMWYAKENAQSRALADRLAAEDVEIDTTRYVKRFRWAKVKNRAEYDKLRNSTEFMVKGDTSSFYNTKRALEAARGNISGLISSSKLNFKRFWNEVVNTEDEAGEDGDGGDDEDDAGEDDGDGAGDDDGWEDDDGDEEMAMLELEAEAEIELMKMRNEAARRKKQNALSGIDPVRLEALRREAWRLKAGHEALDHR
jgi:hypothetical protein